MVNILEEDLWKIIVGNMPISAKDLLFYSDKKGLLMGKRINNPAKDYYFVPGGRVFKNENRDDAIKRISNHEVGLILNSNNYTSIGTYDHFYPDSIWENTKVTTHYIVEAILILIGDEELNFNIRNQHSDLIWINESNIGKEKVHKYSMKYLSDILMFRRSL